MAEAEGKTPQGTMLSAEVAPFIPGQSNPSKSCSGRAQPNNLQPQAHQAHTSGQIYNGPPNTGHTHLGSINSKMSAPPLQTISTSNGSSYTLTELPRYLTNCYPFVQDSVTGTGPKPEVRWPNYSSHQQPAPQSIGSSLPYPTSTTDMYTNQHYPVQTSNYVMQYPQSYFSHAPGLAPPQSQGTMQTPVPMPQGSFHVPPHYPGYYPNYPQDGHQLQMGTYQNLGYGPYMHREQAQRQSKNSSSRERQVPMSDTPRDRSCSSSSQESRRYPKTLVCMDASCQTDFPDDIANKTLAEKPSMLRRHKSKPRRRSQGNQTGQETSTSTDSETETGAVDSDSGYYSPKHAKTNHTSVGMATHDTGTGPTLKVQGYQQYTGTAVSSVPRHVTQNHQPGGTAAMYTPNSVNSVVPQMMPAASFPQPQHAHLGMTPRIQQHPQHMQQPQQQHMQQPSLNQHIQQPISYARILSQPPQQRQTVPVLNQSQHRPPGPVHQQPQFNQSIENLRKRQTIPSGPFLGSQTPPHRSGTNHIPIQEPVESALAPTSKRKKKKERKRAGGKGLEGGEEQGNDLTVQPPPVPPALTDMGDFPQLPIGTSGGPGGVGSHSTQPWSYSAILQQQKPPPIRQQMNIPVESEPVETPEANHGDIIKPEDLLNPEAAASGIRDGKNARKRRKKAILAAQAAAKEYSEITEEQRQLQENLKKPSKKTKMPIEYDLGDMLAALEKQQQETKAKTQQQVLASKGRTPSTAAAIPKVQQQQHTEIRQSSVPSTVKTTIPKQPVGWDQEVVLGHNPLDSSAPIKRGKERETPVKKKPSALKRVILKEREENKRLRTLQETCLSDAEDGLTQGDDKPIDSMSGDAGLGLSQDASERGSNMSPFMTSQSDLSPLSQMSPMSMSPLSPGSPLSSGLSSPATGFKSASPAQANNPSIHSRRFREYCNQVLDKDIDACCTTLLQTLVRFQDRQYHKDPSKAKAKRRIVMGLREVTKHLKLKKIKCIMVSPNLERIQSKGGLDDALNRIMALSTEQDVPVVFALGRKALGRAVNKLVPVSVVGIFNYDGAEEFYKNLLDLTKSARDSYNAMIRKYQQELEAAATAVPFTKHRHHLGHYRNLSGCSGISFTSVISEPISEDYPDPEPEVDSRGNEIVREVRFDDAVTTTQYAMAAPVSTLTTQAFAEASDMSGDYESDKGFSQEGTHSEDSGTVEQGASKTSSETLEAAELDDVDDEEGENEDTYELSDVDEELDGIDADFHQRALEDDDDDEDDEDEDDEEEDRGISVLNSKTDLPLDKGRIAHWVAETQSTIQSLTLDDCSMEEESTSLDVKHSSESIGQCLTEDQPSLRSSQDYHSASEKESIDKVNISDGMNPRFCQESQRKTCHVTSLDDNEVSQSSTGDAHLNENHVAQDSQESS